MNAKKERQSNLELLRIICMLMIVAFHMSFFNKAEFPTDKITIERVWMQYYVAFGHTAVNIFVIISGYFAVSSVKLNLSRLARMWCEMFTYSVLGYVFAIVFMDYPLTGDLVIAAITPLLYPQWTFASAFFVMTVFSPFINILLKKLTKKQFRLLLIIIGILWVAVPTFLAREAEGNYLTWVTSAYMIGAYIRMYPEDFTKSARYYRIAAGIVAGASLLLILGFDIVGLWIPFFGKYATHFSGFRHINSVALSIFMFLAFAKADIKQSKFINTVAGTTFGVYLIHEDYYIREFLWRRIFNAEPLMNSWLLIPVSILEVLAVFVVCSVIEYGRIHLLEKHYMRTVDKYLAKLQEKIDYMLQDS